MYDAVKNHGKLLMQANVTQIDRKEVIWTDKKGEEYCTPLSWSFWLWAQRPDSTVADQLQIHHTQTPRRRIGDCNDLAKYRGCHALWTPGRPYHLICQLIPQ